MMSIAIPRRLRSDCRAIAKQLQRDCKAITEGLQSNQSIAKRFHSDFKAMHSDCRATA
jgi:hypothetical protein